MCVCVYMCVCVCVCVCERLYSVFLIEFTYPTKSIREVHWRVVQQKIFKVFLVSLSFSIAILPSFFLSLSLYIYIYCNKIKRKEKYK